MAAMLLLLSSQWSRGDEVKVQTEPYEVGPCNVSAKGNDPLGSFDFTVETGFPKAKSTFSIDNKNGKMVGGLTMSSWDNKNGQWVDLKCTDPISNFQMNRDFKAVSNFKEMGQYNVLTAHCNGSISPEIIMALTLDKETGAIKHLYIVTNTKRKLPITGRSVLQGGPGVELITQMCTNLTGGGFPEGTYLNSLPAVDRALAGAQDFELKGVSATGSSPVPPRPNTLSRSRR